MAQYNSLNVKLSNLQLSKLKLAIKNKPGAVLRWSSSIIGNSNDEPNFLHKLLLINRQVASLRKAFANNSSTDIMLSKAQLSKMIQLVGFLSRLLGPLLNTGLPLMKNSIKPLAKSVLISVRLTAAASAADARIHKKILRSGTATLIISNDEMEDIMKIVKSLVFFVFFSLVYFILLLKEVRKTIQHEVKEQKGGFLSMLLDTLDATSLLGNVLTGKGIIRAGEGTIRAVYRSKKSLIKNF